MCYQTKTQRFRSYWIDFILFLKIFKIFYKIFRNLPILSLELHLFKKFLEKAKNFRGPLHRYVTTNAATKINRGFEISEQKRLHLQVLYTEREKKKAKKALAIEPDEKKQKMDTPVVVPVVET